MNYQQITIQRIRGWSLLKGTHKPTTNLTVKEGINLLTLFNKFKLKGKGNIWEKKRTSGRSLKDLSVVGVAIISNS